MPICAYCGQERAATREHVIPAFVYAFQKRIEAHIGWSEVAGRMIQGEGKVKDVCAECNNTILGPLDDYGKGLLTATGILVPNFERTSLILQYDYNLLLRWLLKVSFNSSRCDGAHRHLFERHVPFILGSAAHPPRHQVACLAYLAAPERVETSHLDSATFFRATRGLRVFNPFLARISYAIIPGENSYTLRLNAFGPLMFHLVLFQEHVLPGHASASLRKLMKRLPGLVELSSKLKLIQLTCGSETWLDLYRDQIARTRAVENG
jgi:hypothetical protein